MKIVHIMKKEKFTSGIAVFYNQYFVHHTIMYRNYRGSLSLINKDLMIKQKEFFSLKEKTDILDSFRIYKELRDYDYVVLHSMSVLRMHERFLVTLSHATIKKIVWIEWGSDLYEWEKKGATSFCEKIKEKIKNYINKRIRDRIPYVVCIFPPDMEFYKKEFPLADATVFYAPYCGTTSPGYYRKKVDFSRLCNDKKEGNSIVVQIGHNAMSSLNHIDALRYMSRFRDENIKILLPLSYAGKGDYTNIVKKEAETIFGNKAIVLTEFLSEKEYYKLMDSVDIAIFNTYRQAGLGNIYKHIWIKTKLYLPEGGIMYRFFKDYGIPVQTVEQLKNETFEEFVSVPVIEDVEKYNEFNMYRSSMEWKIDKWKRIYEFLEKRGMKE